VLLLRDRGGVADAAFEVCVMQRSLHSTFMGGAVVFPGGRTDAEDALDRWPLDLLERSRVCDSALESARITACRESLEEVGLLPVCARDGAPVVDVTPLRVALASSIVAFREALASSRLRLDLASLTPLSRWVTPEAEPKRFDTHFFLARAPQGQVPRSDEREAIRVLWATPRALLEEYESGAITLFPPTHRSLEWLACRRSIDEALAVANRARLDEICPVFKLIGDLPVLALPGDPLHPVGERRIDGATRYVLRGDVWRSEDAP
jgi:8-oxo-dGTP pyrophosphatase MutT (NUDIX family)